MRQKVATGTNASEIRLRNISAVLMILLRNEGISRVQVAQLMGLSNTTITNLISDLLEQGLVTEEGVIKNGEKSSVGRPQMALRLVPDARYAIGIYIEVGRVRVALTDLHAQAIETHILNHDLSQPADAVLPQIASLVETVIAARDRQKLVGIGVAASGLVNPYTGVNVTAPNLGWHDVPMRDYFSTQLRLPVFVDNNVRAMALGEALFGSPQQAQTLAFIYARIGVGAGLIVGGQVYRGAGAGAGEIGHTTMILEGGEQCQCGNYGCLQTVFSESVILRLAQQQRDFATIEDIFTAVRDGDAFTRTLLNERTRYMGIALANLVDIFNPEVIVLGGLFAQAPDLFLPSIEDQVQQHAFANLGKQVRVQVTSFGHDAGIVGAAALALDHFFYRAYPEIAYER